MATLLSVERPTYDGVRSAKTALDEVGHEFRLTKDTQFAIENGPIGLNLTILTNRTLAGIALGNKVIAIGAYVARHTGDLSQE